MCSYEDVIITISSNYYYRYYCHVTHSIPNALALSVVFLTPYVVNIKKLSYDEAFTVIKDWLKVCSKMTPLDFNANNRIKDNLKAAMKVRYLPISLNDLKVENRELYTRVTKS